MKPLKKTTIIHLCVDTITTPASGPVVMLENFLQPFFTRPGELVVKSLQFNLTTEALRKKYHQDALAVAAALDTPCGSNVVFTLLCHSDEDRGDLTIGFSRHRKLELASPIQSVLDILLMPFEKLVPNAVFFMFACGSVMSNVESFDDFRKAIAQ